MPGMTMRMNVRRTTPPFNPLVYSPALWLDASDASTLVMDGAVLISVNNLCLKCPDSPIFRADGQIWVAFWAKFAYTNNPRIPYIKGDAAAAATYEHGFVVETTTNNARLSISNGSSVKVAYTATNPTLNNWHFYFGYIDPANNIAKASLDGGTFGTVNLTGFTPSVGSNDFVVGAGNPTGTNYRVDYIDSFAVGKPSSAGWLASNAAALASYLYNSGSGRRSSDFMSSPYYTGGNPSGAGSWYDMDERSGNRVDRIGSNNLTPAGSAAASIGYAAGVASGLVQYTGDPVKQWSDKSGNARHATATSDSTRPSYTTGVQNGLSAILYDAVDDKLDLGSALSLTDQTIFAVVKLASDVTAATTAKIVLTVVSGDASVISFGSATGALTNERLSWLRVVTGAVYGKGQVTANITAGAHVYGFQYTNATPLTEIWQDGTAQTLTNCTLGEANSSRPYTGYQRIGNILGDHLCELIILPSVISAADVAKFHRYLGNKWGITVA